MFHYLLQIIVALRKLNGRCFRQLQKKPVEPTGSASCCSPSPHPPPNKQTNKISTELLAVNVRCWERDIGVGSKKDSKFRFIRSYFQEAIRSTNIPDKHKARRANSPLHYDRFLCLALTGSGNFGRKKTNQFQRMSSFSWRILAKIGSGVRCVWRGVVQGVVTLFSYWGSSICRL